MGFIASSDSRNRFNPLDKFIGTIRVQQIAEEE
jgi:hypothetical protein